MGVALAAGALVAEAIGVVGLGEGAADGSDPPPAPVPAACDPQITMLHPLPGDVGAAVYAINDHGLMAGSSYAALGSIDGSAVLWRDTTAPQNLGFGGGEAADGAFVNAAPADVNENGAIAVNVTRSRDLVIHLFTAWVWRNGVRTRLRGTARRPWVIVNALNDHGVAVGLIQDHRSRAMPAAWRKGRLIRLPVPAWATGGVALENNNRAVVIGRVQRHGRYLAWWWRLGGRNGPLRGLPGQPRPPLYTEAVDIDDQNRVVGTAPIWTSEGPASYPVQWRHPRLAPRRLPTRQIMTALGAGRHLIGSRQAGTFQRGWIARLHGPATRLPVPPPPNPEGWRDIVPADLARGVSVFAPQGGVTVAGNGWSSDPSGEFGIQHPIIWTCAQSYLK